MHHKRGRPKSSRAGCTCGAKLFKQPGCTKPSIALGDARHRREQAGAADVDAELPIDESGPCSGCGACGGLPECECYDDYVCGVCNALQETPPLKVPLLDLL